ncbi:hypothetical protein Nepgr_033420 [Nepenthes gracilis]|uniref:Uncharacterized protein n=1 Tax=Nepenthes gracilis TaxID=150966 RepID=A0AAD3Y8Y9_NEPGR|nr:hypothetical protein Nepgr_033420 [Nepenthes gracilis]
MMPISVCFAILRSKNIEAPVCIKYTQIVPIVYKSIHRRGGIVLLALLQRYQVIATNFLQVVASKKNRTQLWAHPSPSYRIIPIAESVEAIRHYRCGNSIKINANSVPPISQPLSSPDPSPPTIKEYGGAAFTSRRNGNRSSNAILLTRMSLYHNGSNVTLGLRMLQSR